VYDSIQAAVDAASSYVRIGEGQFNESLNISGSGLKVLGSGESTVISSKVDINSANISLSRIRFSSEGRVHAKGANGIECMNCQFESRGVSFGAGPTQVFLESCNNWVFTNCKFDGTNVNDTRGVQAAGSNNGVFSSNLCVGNLRGIDLSLDFSESAPRNVIIANNVFKESTSRGIQSEGADTVVHGNLILNTVQHGVGLFGSGGHIVTNNIIKGYGGNAITDSGGSNKIEDNKKIQ
jgi:hypothetical protein